MEVLHAARTPDSIINIINWLIFMKIYTLTM